MVALRNQLGIVGVAAEGADIYHYSGFNDQGMIYIPVMLDALSDCLDELVSCGLLMKWPEQWDWQADTASRQTLACSTASSCVCVRESKLHELLAVCNVHI
jgi:hypothetical protein